MSSPDLMSDTPERYITFKRTDWSAWIARFIHVVPEEISLEEIRDAVVIRCQDTFAPPALEGYANGITVTVEVLKLHGEFTTAARLQNIADYFHEKATISWEMIRKLPD